MPYTSRIVFIFVHLISILQLENASFPGVLATSAQSDHFQETSDEGSSCMKKISITGSNLEELEEQLRQKVYAAMMQNPDGVLSISTELTYGDDVVTFDHTFPSVSTTDVLFKQDPTTDKPIRSTSWTRDVNDCGVYVNGICYWVNISSSVLDYMKAEDICHSQDATVAIIPDQDTYNKILELLESELSKIENWLLIVWTGLTVNSAGSTIPENAFTTWTVPTHLEYKHGYIRTSSGHFMSTLHPNSVQVVLCMHDLNINSNK